MTVAEYQLALASLEKECPECHGECSHTETEADGGEFGSCHDIEVACEACHGSGKVSLLNGVREKCPCIDLYADTKSHWEDLGGCDRCYFTTRGGDHPGHAADCRTCQGRGWVPTTDPWKWFEVMARMGAIEFYHEDGYWCEFRGLAYGPQLSLALVTFQAFAKTLGVGQ